MANIIPTVAKLDPYADTAEAVIEDLMSLKPKPDKDVLLVVGDGSSMPEDYVAFQRFGIDHDTMAMNYSAYALKEWGEKFQHFIAGDSHFEDMQKVAQSLNNGCVKHCWNPGCGEEKGFDVRWVKQDHRGWSGTTANLGVKIGITLGYLRIVLAGVPMDRSGHWYDKYLPEKDIKRTHIHAAHLWFWTELATRPVGKFIRSMSGNTKDLLGEPTHKWLMEVIANG